MTTDIQGQLEDGMLLALKSSTALNLLVGQKVYLDVPPEATITEFVIARYQGGGDDQDTQRGSVEFEYLVEMYSLSLTRARQGAQGIRDALHLQSLPLVGWDNYFSISTRRHSLVEHTDGLTYYRRGGIYVFRAAAERI